MHYYSLLFLDLQFLIWCFIPQKSIWGTVSHTNELFPSNLSRNLTRNGNQKYQPERNSLLDETCFAAITKFKKDNVVTTKMNIFLPCQYKIRTRFHLIFNTLSLEAKLYWYFISSKQTFSKLFPFLYFIRTMLIYEINYFTTWFNYDFL